MTLSHDTARRTPTTAAEIWRRMVEPGMNVAGVAGDMVGRVSEVRSDTLVIDRTGSLGMMSASAVALPFERVHAIFNGRITLDIPSSRIDEYGASVEAS